MFLKKLFGSIWSCCKKGLFSQNRAQGKIRYTWSLHRDTSYLTCDVADMNAMGTIKLIRSQLLHFYFMPQTLCAAPPIRLCWICARYKCLWGLVVLWLAHNPQNSDMAASSPGHTTFQHAVSLDIKFIYICSSQAKFLLTGWKISAILACGQGPCVRYWGWQVIQWMHWLCLV